MPERNPKLNTLGLCLCFLLTFVFTNLFPQDTTSLNLPHSSELQDPDHHSFRYMFGTNALNMDVGNAYYTTYTGLLHEVQFGFTENLSVKFGASLLGQFWALPQYNIPINENSGITISDLVIAWTGDEAVANFIYAQYTVGNENAMLSAGAGYVATNDTEWEWYKTSTLGLTFSFMLRMGERSFFINELYGANITAVEWSSNDSRIKLPLKYIHLYSWTGLRFIGKHPRNCWQFGVFGMGKFNPDDIPQEYAQDNIGVESYFMPLPFVSFSRMLGNTK